MFTGYNNDSGTFPYDKNEKFDEDNDGERSKEAKISGKTAKYPTLDLQGLK